MRKRLPLDRCRSLLPSDLALTLQDEELEQLVNGLYILADVVTEIYLQFDAADNIDNLLERAAIMEIDGGLDAAAAFAAALASVRPSDSDESGSQR